MANLDQIQQFNEGYIYPQDYQESYIATKHICFKILDIPANVIEVLKEKISEKGLYFGNDELLKEIVVGIIKGNVILQGPPGTGKTTLAKIICDVFNVSYDERTAAAEWTTFDTIGGLQPSTNESGQEIMIGKLGCVTNSVYNCCNAVLKKEHYNGEKQANWLILDELNRCEIDKAFGDLFTVFGSDGLSEKRAISLWFENDENKKKIFMPNCYRIIGAMNNIDKNFVFDMSQGLSRRFTFINILPPSEEFFSNEIVNAKAIARKRVKEKLGNYNGIIIDNKYMDTFEKESVYIDAETILIDFLKHIRYFREEDDSYLGLAIGTAQIIDLFENIYLMAVVGEFEKSDDKQEDIYNIIDSSVGGRIVPQMDGFDYIRLSNYCDEIGGKPEYKFFKHTLAEIRKFNH